MNNSFSESYKAAGVDITAGYKAVEPKHPKVPPISAASADFLFRIWPE